MGVFFFYLGFGIKSYRSTQVFLLSMNAKVWVWRLYRRTCHFDIHVMWHYDMMLWWHHVTLLCDDVMELLCHFHGVTLLRDEVITWSHEFSCYLVVMPLARWTLDFPLYGAYNALTLKLDILMSIPWHFHSYPKCDNLHKGSSIAALSETKLLCSLKFCCSRPSSAAH